MFFPITPKLKKRKRKTATFLLSTEPSGFSSLMKKLLFFILAFGLLNKAKAQQDSAAPPAHASVLSFQVQQHQKLVLLAWAIEEGWMYKSFEVERSEDGVNYSKIGSRLGISKNNEGSFDFVDATPKKPITLIYRLKLISVDGLATYSENKEIKFTASTWDVRLKQNPVHGDIDLEVESSTAKQLTITIISNAGQQVMAQTFRITTGKNKLTLSFQGMRQGLYQLIAEADNERKTISFIKE